MDYSEWKYLYPPRAEHIITRDVIKMYEMRGWWGQYKKNGTSTTVTVDPQGNVRFMTRHAEPHKAWQCPTWLLASILERVPKNVWTMFVAELLHSKTPSIKDTLFIYDVVVYKSQHLVGTSFQERQKILNSIFPCEGKEEYSHWELCAGVWRAKNLTQNLTEVFQAIEDPKVDEGLVLKNPKDVLDPGTQQKNNTRWQVKVRYPTKNYQF